MNITLTDLGLAYRKAKVDLYYSSHPPLDSMAAYEEDLHSNLSKLLKKINGRNEKWVANENFLGAWTLAAKSIESKKEGGGLIFSSPEAEWDALIKQGTPKAEFRIMARCSMDFHVLSTLWILKVGHLFDEKLSDCAYGNRLRRTQDSNINRFSIGSFQPYLKPFRDWRDKGIEVMRLALGDGKKIVAVTADVKSFYHELNPHFMLDEKFINEVLKLELSEESEKLNRLFITALKLWATKTPLKKGLPVGLPASAVVANMALVELDRIIEQQIVPLYYGRYVDDIILVMESGARFGSTTQVWEWLLARSDGKLAWKRGDEEGISFKPDYLGKGEGKSRILFSNSKNKMFLLSGETGMTLVNSIACQIHQRASEWRAMPRLPRISDYVGTDMLAATQNDGEAADNLRKAGALTMRRAGFAIKLRDFEAYERDLLPDSWAEHRRAFFRAFVDHVLVLPRFFDLETYLPRVVRLATACEDYYELKRIIDGVSNICKKVEKDCEVKINSWPSSKVKPNSKEIVGRWRRQIFTTILESIVAAFPTSLSKKGKQSWQSNMGDYEIPDFDVALQWPGSIKQFQSQHARFFSLDLAHLPFRFIGLPEEMVNRRGIPNRRCVVSSIKFKELLPEEVTEGCRLLTGLINFREVPNALFFATRPFSLSELYIVNNQGYYKSEQEDMKKIVLSVRGFCLGEKSPCFDENNILQIPDGGVSGKYGIAVSSWLTNIESWIARVMRMPDPDAERYGRLCRLLDIVISQPYNSRYLTLPELALPAHWFFRIARKLQGRGISLIAGIEYLHSSKQRVRNQVWAALTHDGLGFPSLMVYRQDKQNPALHEERELQRLAGLKMKPEKSWRTPPVIQHGEFRFAILICSELTNIKYRADLRGKVDAIFVLEWNQDTETFNALIESAALDVHSFIIQCNDRYYGDSRIRAPFKDSWRRDLLRVKGGVTDYCVIGEIDIQLLRQFQSAYRSPDGPYKPLPDGFELDFQRRMLPFIGNTRD